ncbi:MAG: signal recognition particle subunit SRP19/SEC65 family protein [Candidatus Heimdallarchaeota archaeon]|nr:signal recognition particle subunit SRP19/SEC65 family protein [Candidatus Heimdallarchaeota archaeon]
MLRRKKYYVIYPEYFDKSISRKRGRRVSIEQATEEATLKKVEYAVKKLELPYELQKDKAYPNNWWEQRGRLLLTIDKKNKIPKQNIIHDIADITRKLKTKKKETVTKEKTQKQTYQKKSTHGKKRSSYQTKKQPAKKKTTKKRGK